MKLTIFVCGLLFYLHYQVNECYSKMVTVTYFNTEHPVVDWYDKRYYRNITMLSRRINRQDPRHYVELYIHPLITINNSITVDFYFYQFLTNRYRPSFVEMHFKFCDMVNSDTFFGQTMRNSMGGRPCPYPPGIYDLKNLSIPYVPKGFPFPKGRIYCNLSISEGGVTKLIGRGSIDMELKMEKISKN